MVGYERHVAVTFTVNRSVCDAKSRRTCFWHDGTPPGVAGPRLGTVVQYGRQTDIPVKPSARDKKISEQHGRLTAIHTARFACGCNLVETVYTCMPPLKTRVHGVRSSGVNPCDRVPSTLDRSLFARSGVADDQERPLRTVQRLGRSGSGYGA